ncbi:endonuclease/exonuclease/phosphatase family protein [Cyclobacterium sp.]|uniref:endonuclease/exonuclease/phosphatase family protein n=1 Tax=Cyclobacterium sp. TaxID=1966343 RepID=UPI0019A4B791|nr:endonuclease/exonuclease/phosphatase family protein [Cyclobacterium sp.]MBD3627307.1 endonuclease/exonuclease/phosphatase family protein [Cyclobacterium sp.]
MKYFIYIPGLVAIVITALPVIDTGTWWIRIFDFPRIQITVFALFILLLAFLFLKDKPKIKYSFISLLLAAISYQLVMIAPFTPLLKVSAKSASLTEGDNQFTLLMSNVRMENTDRDKLLSLIRKKEPDLVLLTEPNLIWTKALIELDETYPHAIKEPLSNTYGMILLSKFPLINPKVNYLVENNIPSFHTQIKLPSGGIFDFYGVHPEPPKPGSDTYERDTELLLIGKKIKKDPKPVIVAGDLNDVGWSQTSHLFREYSQLVDPREGRGFYNTYNVFIPLMRYPLDHVFYSNDFGLVSFEKLEEIGSDHFPMWIDLTFEPDASDPEEVENTDAEENAEVEEKIEKGK